MEEQKKSQQGVTMSEEQKVFYRMRPRPRTPEGWYTGTLNDMLHREMFDAQDLTRVASEVFYTVRSSRESAKRLHLVHPEVEEKLITYRNEGLEYADMCLFRFQELCVEKGLPFHNPVALIQALCDKDEKCWQDESYLTILQYALCDCNFIYGCSVGRYMPPYMARPATIEAVCAQGTERVKEIGIPVVIQLYESREVISPERAKEVLPKMRREMYQQFREFQMYNPRLVMFTGFIQNVFQPCLCRQTSLQRSLRRHDWGLGREMCEEHLAGTILSIANTFLGYLEDIRTAHPQQKKGKKNSALEVEVDLLKFRSELDQYRSAMKINGQKYKDTKIYEAFYSIATEVQSKETVFEIAPFYIFWILVKNTEKLKRLEPLELSNKILPKMRSIHADKPCSIEVTARREFRCKLLLFDRLRGEWKYSDDKQSSFLLERMYGYSLDDFMAGSKEAEQREEYILNGDHTDHRYQPLLKQIAGQLHYSLSFSPFDVMRYTKVPMPEMECYAQAYSTKARTGKKKGRQKSPQAAVEAFLEKSPADTLTLVDWHKKLLFTDPNGIGSGLRSYQREWKIARVLDQTLAAIPELEALAKALPNGYEVVQFCIQNYCIQEICQETKRSAMQLAKKFFDTDACLRSGWLYTEPAEEPDSSKDVGCEAGEK